MTFLAAAAPYGPGLLLLLAAVLGGLRSSPAWLAFGAALLAWLALPGRALRANGREPALLFFCWLAAAALFSSDLASSLGVAASLGLLAALAFAAEAADGKGWLRAVTALGVAATFFFFFQRLSGQLPSGFIGANPNYSAVFAAAAFPAALYGALGAAGRRRAALLALAGLLAAGVLLSGSRGALAAAFLAGAAGLWFSGRRTAFAVYLLAGAAAAALLPAGALEGLLKLDDPRAFARPQLWGAALRAAAAAPALGWGPGLFENVFEVFKFPYFDGAAYYWHTTKHAHGELFNLAAEGGFPAAVLFALAAGAALFRGGEEKLHLKLVLLAVFLQGCVDMIFYSGAVGLLFWGTFGALTAGEAPGGRQSPVPRLLLAGAVLAAFLAGAWLKTLPSGAAPGSYPEAVLARARVAALRAPKDALARSAVGDALLAAGDRPGAGAAYSAALALEPNLARARLGLAAALGAERSAEACGELELARRAAGLEAGERHRELLRLDGKEAARLEKDLCRKKKAGGATASGRKTP